MQQQENSITQTKPKHENDIILTTKQKQNIYNHSMFALFKCIQHVVRTLVLAVCLYMHLCLLIDVLIDMCLTPPLAVLQLYRAGNKLYY